MRVLGIDPGLQCTGYGVLEHRHGEPVLLEAGVVRTNAKESLEKRLGELGREIAGIVEQFNPDVMAVEELYSHYGHPKTAIIMGHARGVIFCKAAEAGVEVFPYASTRIKKSLTGNGQATKSQVQKMIRQTLELTAVPEPADAADALAVALCHCRVTDNIPTHEWSDVSRKKKVTR